MEKVFYFAEVFDSIKFVSVISGATTGIVAVGILLLNLFSLLDEDERIVINKAGKLITIITIIFATIAIICPSKKTYIYMKVGEYVDETVADKPEVKELPENAILLLNEYVKRELKK